MNIIIFKINKFQLLYLGTETLVEFLQMNPNINFARGEVWFFDKYYDRGLQWYRLVYKLK